MYLYTYIHVLNLMSYFIYVSIPLTSYVYIIVCVMERVLLNDGIKKVHHFDSLLQSVEEMNVHCIYLHII